jgi:NAD(P)-dependent dehydrogenase (short-subunit alcohol dehydrogenase family)
MGSSCEGRVALVTGASRGIGRAIAVRLASEGADVAIVARPRSGAGAPEHGTLEAAAEQIRSLGARVLAVEKDLGVATADRGALIDQVEAELGPVDILVNNAAGGGFRDFMDWTDEQITRVLELNFWLPWHLIRRALPGMRERRRGWILNISSSTAAMPSGPPFVDKVGSKQGTIYGGSKAFLDRWTASLASELHGSGVAANTLAPKAAAASEILVSSSSIPESVLEPLETMSEAALALCTGDPDVLTNRITYSLDLLLELARPVYDVEGRKLLEGWQPADLPDAIKRADEFKQTSVRVQLPG